MQPLHIAITLFLIVFQFTCPKRLAFLPLMIAALHTSYSPVIPSFTTARLIILAGVLRAMISGDLKWSFRNSIDRLMLLWGIFAIASSIGHEDTYVNPFIVRVRMVIDVCGTYLYAKSFIRNLDDYERLAKTTAFSLIPLALAMWYTKLTGGFNLYSLVGGSSSVMIREGSIRAIGPFGTPILAGTVGALIVPLVLILWRDNKKVAKIGLICCMGLIFSTGSSTPIGALLIGCTALYFWRWRTKMKSIIIFSVIALILMDLVKDRPIWYLIAITDFVGGSTGWHRAHLIDMAIEHFDEWWICGTEYTRHWMPYGLRQVPNHSDMTNYFIHLGVLGGAPLMAVLILVFWKSFNQIKLRLHALRESNNQDEFIIWCIGALLFTHALTCLTISYFDQTFILFYFLIAVISNLKEMPLQRDPTIARNNNIDHAHITKS